MWAFIESIVTFVLLISGIGFWQHSTRRTSREQAAAVEQQIVQAAKVAQRRHVQRFGQQSADLSQALNGHLK